MRLGLILAGVIALLAGAAAFGPMLFDWSRFKPEIEARLERALGREVRIEGPLSLSLLPGPRFSASGLTIANSLQGSDPIMARVRQLRLNLAPLPLLTGTIKIDSLTLDHPSILLERGSGQAPNWIFGKAEEPGATAATPPDGARPIRPPGEVRESTPADFGLDRVIIRDGVVIYRSGEGAPWRLDHLEADIRAGTLAGPFDAKGSVVAGGVPVAFSGAAGAFAPDRGTPVSFELRLQRADASIRFNGLLSNLSAGRTVRGKLSLVAQNLEDALREAGVATALPPPARAKAIVEGEVQASEREIAVNALSLRIGDMIANGALTVLPQDGPQIDLAISLPNLNLDKWLASAPTAAKQASPQDPAPAAAGGGGGGPEKAAIIPGRFGIALPTGIDATVDVSADGVVWHGQALRQVSLHFGLQGGKLQIHQGLALLPAGSELRFNGIFEDTLAPVGKGALEMRSDNLRGVLGWLGVPMPDVPPDRLRRFLLAGGWETSGDLITLTDLDATLDTSRVTGTGTVRLGERVGFGINASVDSINVDAYRGAPEGGAAQAPDAAATAQSVPPTANPVRADDKPPLAALAAVDAELKLSVGQILWGGAVASHFVLDGTLWNGRLALREASLEDLAGTGIKLSGEVTGLDGTPRLSDFSLDLAARQPNRLVRVLGLESVGDLSRLGPTTLKAAAAGPLDKLAVDANLAFGGGSLAAKGELVGLPAAPAGELALTLTHPSFAQLLAQLGDYRPSGPFGPVRLAATLIADSGRLSLSEMDGALGPMALGGNLLADWSGRPRIEAALTAGDIPLDAFLSAKSNPAVPRRGHDPAGIHQQPQVQTAQPVAATTAPPPAGGAPWSSTPVDLSGLATFDAKVGIAAKSLTWDGTRFESPVMSLVVSEGRATVERLDAGLYGGSFGLTGTLAVQPKPSVSAKVSIEGAEVREAMKGGGGIAVTGGILNGSADLATTGLSTLDWVGNLAGQGRFAVRDGLVSGFNLQEVNQKLGNIENVVGLIGLVQAGLSGGQTRFSSLTGTVQAQSGILTSNDLRLNADGGSASGTVRIDLPRYLLDARVGIKIAGAPDAPPLGIRLEGALDAPRKFLDINDIQRHLLGKGLGRALKGRGEGLLQGLLGGGKSASPTEPPASSGPDAGPAQQGADNPGQGQGGKKPEDFVRELLKGLGR